MSEAAISAATKPLLLVEDEAPIAEIIRRLLESRGYKVVAAASGVEALKLLGPGDFLGVITDMRTPGGVSGADLHAWIEANRPELLSRVVFITGDIASPETQAILTQTGAPRLEKPFKNAELIAMVEKTFGKPR
jgi:CheY-like chemotaxis protein